MFDVGMPTQSKMMTAGNGAGWNGMQDPRKGTTPGFSPSGVNSPMNPNGGGISNPSQRPPQTGQSGMNPGTTNGTLIGTTGAVQPYQNHNNSWAGMMTPISGPPVQNPVSPTPVPNNNNQWQPQNSSPITNPYNPGRLISNGPGPAPITNPYNPGPTNGGFNWGDPNEIRRYFQSRGVTPNASSPDYWVQKWNEWGKNDPAYFMDRLANADEIIGGPQNSPYAFMANNPNNNAGQNGMGQDFGFLNQLFQMLMGGGFRNIMGGGMNQPQQSNYWNRIGSNPNQTMDISRFNGQGSGLQF